MTRVARKQSPTGMYHVMFRGINRQLVFEEDEDYERFLEILSGCKGAGAQGGYRLPGYCLMGNHIHLLVGCDGHPPGDILKRIAIRYVAWFNKKYGRSGHLFQGRYMSEPIKDDAQLLAVLRYIHQNPVKAGLCKRPQEYRFSSWAGYANGSGIADTALALGILSKDKQQQAAAFESFMLADDDEVFMDDRPGRVTERECRRIIEDISGAKSVSGFQALYRENRGGRDKALRRMREQGMSIRQIVRLTGVPFGVVRNR